MKKLQNIRLRLIKQSDKKLKTIFLYYIVMSTVCAVETSRVNTLTLKALPSYERAKGPSVSAGKPVTTDNGSQLLLTIAHLRMEVAELRRENKSLGARNAVLEERMKIIEITKQFNKFAEVSVYRRFFLGRYSNELLHELISRYLFADIPGDIDLKVLKHNINRIGEECAKGYLRTHNGSELWFRGG